MDIIRKTRSESHFGRTESIYKMSDTPKDGDAPPRGADQGTLRAPRDPERHTVRRLSVPNERPLGEAIDQLYVNTPLSLETLPGAKTYETSQHGEDGRYEMGPQIGHGGMGVVRVVTDRNLGRRVAMKSLQVDHIEDPNLVHALITEARLTGQLEHPNIIPVYELGVTTAATPYYTMKLLERHSLREVLARRARGNDAIRREFTLHRLLTIFGQVCMGCHYAHSRGVLHRDLKPENILLGDFGEVLIVDWGIAKVFKRKGRRATESALDAGMIVGTPTYMSPEQAKGRLDIDQRSDVYSLGMVLYEIITGNLPQESKSDDRQQTVPGGALPQLKFQFENADAPAELKRICLQSLGPDPDVRYQTARELWEEVESFLEGSKERERAHQKAVEEVAQGDIAWSNYFDLQREADSLGRWLAEEEKRLMPWDAVSRRIKWWEERLRMVNVKLMTHRAFSEAVKHYHRALGYEATNESARSGLGTLYWARFLQAEEERDFANQVYFGNLAQEVGRQAGDILDVPGRVNVRTVPDGAVVYMVALGEIQADFELLDAHRAGVSPLADIAREAGAYLVMAKKEGYRDVYEGVFVQPGETTHLLMTLNPWFADSPLIGREFELQTLKSALRDAIELREVRSCVLVGASGVGKGHVLHAFNQFLHDMDQIINLMYVECRPLSKMLPYSALVQMIRHRAGIGASEPYTVVRQKITEMVTLAYSNFGEQSIPLQDQQQIALIVDNLLALPAYDVGDPLRLGVLHRAPARYREEILHALLTYFCRLADGAPVVVIVKDGQWMDDSSRQLFKDLLQNLEGRPIFILASLGQSTDAVEADSSGEELSSDVDFPFNVFLRLGPLSRSANRALIRAILKAPVEEDAARRIARGIGDSPFYIQDYLHYLVKVGQLVKRAGRWVLYDPDKLEQFNESILVRVLLDEIGEPGSSFLRLAAVVGEVFWAAAVPVVISQEVINELVNREVIFRRVTSRYADQPEYMFKSRALRRILYEMVPEDQRAGVHNSVAEWIERHGRLDMEESIRLAWHLERAGDCERAARIYADVSHIVDAVEGYLEASEHVERALSLTRDNALRAELRQRRELLRTQLADRALQRRSRQSAGADR